MCVAGLNVSTRPCGHRWYVLHRSCATAANLSNCSAKLQLEGWETRNASCPWCDATTPTLPDSTHRLFGRSSTTLIPSTSSSATRNRSGSDGTLDDALSRVSSYSSTTSSPLSEYNTTRSPRHGDRGMNERLDIYLTCLPHEVLPSARKYYPTYSSCSSTTQSSSAEDAEGATTTMTEFPLVRRTSSGLGKKWRRSVRLSRDLFRS